MSTAYAFPLASQQPPPPDADTRPLIDRITEALPHSVTPSTDPASALVAVGVEVDRDPASMGSGLSVGQGYGWIVVDGELTEGQIEDVATAFLAPRYAPQDSPGEPDPLAFYRSLAPILGASRLFKIDRDYPGIDRNIREGVWDIALAGIEAAYGDGVIESEEEYDAIQDAWDAAGLGRPDPAPEVPNLAAALKSAARAAQ